MNPTHSAATSSAFESSSSALISTSAISQLASPHPRGSGSSSVIEPLHDVSIEVAPTAEEFETAATSLDRKRAASEHHPLMDPGDAPPAPPAPRGCFGRVKRCFEAQVACYRIARDRLLLRLGVYGISGLASGLGLWFALPDDRSPGAAAAAGFAGAAVGAFVTEIAIKCYDRAAPRVGRREQTVDKVLDGALEPLMPAALVELVKHYAYDDDRGTRHDTDLHLRFTVDGKEQVKLYRAHVDRKRRALTALVDASEVANQGAPTPFGEVLDTAGVLIETERPGVVALAFQLRNDEQAAMTGRQVRG
jgi:hypothetical protein